MIVYMSVDEVLIRCLEKGCNYSRLGFKSIDIKYTIVIHKNLLFSGS